MKILYLLCFALIGIRCLSSFKILILFDFIFVAMSKFDWVITPKKNKAMETPPKNCSLLAELYSERRITFAKAYWDKSELLLGTLWGTLWETCQELANSLL
jgi:hypothetical protein